MKRAFRKHKSLFLAFLGLLLMVSLFFITMSLFDVFMEEMDCFDQTGKLICTPTPSPSRTMHPGFVTQSAVPTATATDVTEKEPAVEATQASDFQINPGARVTLVPEIAPDQAEASGVEEAYYVASDGSDSNPGTFDEPWGTLKYASTKVQPGDTLYIRGGSYNEVTVWETHGRADAPITIKNYPGERVIIDGYDTVPYNNGGEWMFEVDGDWYIVSGLEVTGSFDEGAIGVRGANVIIENCFVHHNWSAGITMMGDYGLAQYNRVWYNGLGNEFMSRSRGGWPAALTCARYPSHCTLRGNISWENWGEGISTFEAYNTTIEDNISYNNQQNIYLSDTQFSVVQRNFVYCTPENIIKPYVTQNGILVGDEKRNPYSSDNRIVNNIVYGCERNLGIGTTESTNILVAHNTFVNSVGDHNLHFYSGSCTNCYFMNNLILQHNDGSIAYNDGRGWLFSNNLWSTNPPARLSGSGDILSDPKLLLLGNPYSIDWYQLSLTSPAVDQAQIITQIKEDFFGSLRDEFPDIGAIEYQ